MDSIWVAYKNSYYAALNANKKSTLKNKIQACNGDSKQLHKLVANLTTKCIDNPLSPARTAEELANSFATFFEDKILAIREKFLNIPQYQSETVDIPKLHKFHPMTESGVELMVKKMKTKCCELDPILIKVLKQMLPALLPAITRMVNLSLSCGLFHKDWKTAIV